MASGMRSLTYLALLLLVVGPFAPIVTGADEAEKEFKAALADAVVSTPTISSPSIGASQSRMPAVRVNVRLKSNYFLLGVFAIDFK